jgi:hypothetical protein
VLGWIVVGAVWLVVNSARQKKPLLTQARAGS